MSIQIFILGALTEGEHSPYDVKKKIVEVLNNKIEKASEGSLYYQFDVLCKKGYIEKKEVVHHDNRPNKTIYGITTAGRDKLIEDIYAEFQNFTSVPALYTSLLFIEVVDKKKLCYLIEECIQKLKKQSNDTPIKNAHLIPEHKKKSIELISNHMLDYLEKDIHWMENLLLYLREQEA